MAQLWPVNHTSWAAWSRTAVRARRGLEDEGSAYDNACSPES